MMMLLVELGRLKQEMQSATERADREKDRLHQQLTTLNNDHQTALQEARHAHQDDVMRLNNVNVCWTSDFHMISNDLFIIMT